jgi:hypothetical protein
VATLDAIVADLEVEDATPFLPAPTRTLSVEPVDTGGYTMRSALPVAAASSVRIPAVFGHAERAGTWTVPEHLEVMCTLGEVKLDFRDATFSTDTVVIDASVLLGSLTVIVPPGTQIENECEEFMANSSHPRRGRNRAPPNGILVIIQGTIRLGELSIKERPPTGEEPQRIRGFFTRLLKRGY